MARTNWVTPSPPDPIRGAGVDPEVSAAILIRRFDVTHLRFIVFDQMLPKIANHWRRDEVGALMTDAGLEDVQLAWVNEFSWAAVGRKPQG